MRYHRVLAEKSNVATIAKKLQKALWRDLEQPNLGQYRSGEFEAFELQGDSVYSSGQVYLLVQVALKKLGFELDGKPVSFRNEGNEGGVERDQDFVYMADDSIRASLMTYTYKSRPGRSRDPIEVTIKIGYL